jgi:phage terminase Nu1 subunit (DNA packaging protein)
METLHDGYKLGAPSQTAGIRVYKHAKTNYLSVLFENDVVSHSGGYMATQLEVSEHLDLSVRQVQRLIKNGVMPSAKGKGGYDLNACTKSYIYYLRAASKAGDGEDDTKTQENIDINRERALNLRVDTRLKELKEQQIRRELAPVDALEWVLSKTAAQIAAQLDAIPMRVKRRDKTLTVKQVELVSREIIRCQNACANLTLDLDEYEEEVK